MNRSITAVVLALVGCSDPPPEPSPALALAAGHRHTCALLDGGRVRCWGLNEHGQLGYGHVEVIGDDEQPFEAGDVPLEGPAVQITAGAAHSCALLADGAVQCWGQNSFGQLGYGHIDHIGDDERPGGVVDIGEPAIAIRAGAIHTCALLDGGRVRCWGNAVSGRLGYADLIDIGDDEAPSTAGDVDVGGAVAEIAAGTIHTCARLEGGAVRCWGRGSPGLGDAPGGHGQLGYGNRDDIGDDETPASAGDVDVGGPVTALAAGHLHQCALLAGGAVRCWGRGEGEDNFGQLGYPGGESIGDDEPASAAGDVDLGATATAIAAGDVHTCAITGAGGLRCWGFGGFGQLGYGNRSDIGDDETPAAAGDVPLGAPVVEVVTGTFHTCVRHPGGAVRCFGLAAVGELGSGGVINLGDDEPASEIAPIAL